MQATHNKQKTPIAMLYFSGAGSTKTAVEVLAELLAVQSRPVEVIELFDDTPADVVQGYDFFVIATPTYNEQPAQVVLDFIDRLDEGAVAGTRAYVFATYGLYPINCQRIVAKRLQAKGVRPVGYSGVRAPASDGVLFFPAWLTFLFHYQSNAAAVLTRTARQIDHLADTPAAPVKRAPFKWYTPLDYPFNRLARRTFRTKYRPYFRVVPERWDGQAIDTSYPGAWVMRDGLPHYIDADNRDFALRCVHRTPNQAVIFADKMRDKPRLTPEFYEAHKQKLLAACKQGGAFEVK